jgi:hypothetical protein
MHSIMVNNAITQRLQAAQQEFDTLSAQIHDLERRRDIVAGRIEAFELAVKYIAEMPGSERAKKTAPQPRGAPSTDWRRIFGGLYDRYRAGFGYDEIIGVAGALGIEVVRPSLRTKMMNLVNNGYVERIDHGRFIISPRGETYFGVTMPKKDEAPPATTGGLL